MNLVIAILREILSLFVDDESLALHILLLIAAVAAAVKLAGLDPLAGAALLLVGCLGILALSLRRGSRK